MNNKDQCCECPKYFASKKAFNVHLKNVHGWTPEEIRAGAKNYEIEAINSHRYCARTKQYEYEVKWDGYDETSWQPESTMSDGTMLSEYKAKHKLEKPKKNRTSLTDYFNTLKKGPKKSRTSLPDHFNTLKKGTVDPESEPRASSSASKTKQPKESLPTSDAAATQEENEPLTSSSDTKTKSPKKSLPTCDAAASQEENEPLTSSSDTKTKSPKKTVPTSVVPVSPAKSEPPAASFASKTTPPKKRPHASSSGNKTKPPTKSVRAPEVAATPEAVCAILNHSGDCAKKSLEFEVAKSSGEFVKATFDELVLWCPERLDDYLDAHHMLRTEAGKVVKFDLGLCSVCRDPVPIEDIEGHLSNEHQWTADHLRSRILFFELERIACHRVVPRGTTLFEVKYRGSQEQFYRTSSKFTGKDHQILLKYVTTQKLSPLLVAHVHKLTIRVENHFKETNEAGVVENKLMITCDGFEGLYNTNYDFVAEISPISLSAYFRRVLKAAHFRRKDAAPLIVDASSDNVDRQRTRIVNTLWRS